MTNCGICVEEEEFVNNMGPNILTIERLADFLNGLIKMDREAMHNILLDKCVEINKVIARKAFSKPKAKYASVADILTVMFGKEPNTNIPWLSFQVDDGGKLIRVCVTQPEVFAQFIAQRQNAIEAGDADDD